jgi:hypothetical protein
VAAAAAGEAGKWGIGLWEVRSGVEGAKCSGGGRFRVLVHGHSAWQTQRDDDFSVLSRPSGPRLGATCHDVILELPRARPVLGPVRWNICCQGLPTFGYCSSKAIMIMNAVLSSTVFRVSC